VCVCVCAYWCGWVNVSAIVCMLARNADVSENQVDLTAPHKSIYIQMPPLCRASISFSHRQQLITRPFCGTDIYICINGYLGHCHLSCVLKQMWNERIRLAPIILIYMLYIMQIYRWLDMKSGGARLVNVLNFYGDDND